MPFGLDNKFQNEASQLVRDMRGRDRHRIALCQRRKGFWVREAEARHDHEEVGEIPSLLFK